MEKLRMEDIRGEKGFTLVELAIVMVIIGLLIGGILKGQEMIANAQVTSTVAQAKALDAATSTFRDQYNAFPGDMATADTRLRDCDGSVTAACDAGDGDGRVNITVGGVNANNDEGGYFFNQLRVADLISGFDGTATDTFGTAFPAAPVGGGFMVGSSIEGATGFDAANLRTGHYIVLTGQIADVADDTGQLTPSQAARIDRKMDDGNPATGSVVGDNTADNCRAAATDTEYQEGSTDGVCNIAIRIQG
ncbi:MAG: prepilin-type N-terminal cleavage/methylation domain-containing protein [Alphaproteobacteria bacterium]|nr:prepilin-type N-terminal cleavage/methylation domain-containing protein [Alphaproteobacteria bacterium]